MLIISFVIIFIAIIVVDMCSAIVGLFVIVISIIIMPVIVSFLSLLFNSFLAFNIGYRYHLHTYKIAIVSLVCMMF